MLQTKSFKFSEGAEISNFLKENRISNGGDMLTSNGDIVIPYDDGEPSSIAHQIVDAKMLRNAKQKEADLMVHSQKVLEVQAAGIQKEIDRVKELVVAAKEKINYTPKSHDDKKANLIIENEIKGYESEIKRLENVLNQNGNTMLMNQAELTNIMTNIAVFNETIAALSASKTEAA